MPADVTGKRPLSFSDSTGKQRFVPLSALEFVDSDVLLKANWQGAFAPADATILLALANELAASGDLTTPPLAPRSPAIGFKAVASGPEGNNITVSLKVGTGPALSAPITITAKEVDSWSGLTTPDSAAMKIGVDTKPQTDADPPAGTGLVRVKPAASPPGPGLLPAAQTLKVKNAATKVVASDAGATELFKLVSREGYSGTGIDVVITPAAGTFAVTATHDSGPTPGHVTLDTLDKLPKDVAALVEAFAPPVGIALATDDTLPLSGGGPGVAASVVFFTS
jgi:hypothetical protein